MICAGSHTRTDVGFIDPRVGMLSPSTLATPYQARAVETRGHGARQVLEAGTPGGAGALAGALGERGRW